MVIFVDVTYLLVFFFVGFFFFKQKTAYEMRISDWSSDVCSSDLSGATRGERMAARISRCHLRNPRCTASRGKPHHPFTPSAASRGKPHKPFMPSAVSRGKPPFMPSAARSAGYRGTGTAPRSEERRVGKEGVSTCRTRGLAAPRKK